MTKTFYKTLRGYTAQAHWFAANLGQPTEAGEWTQLGWTKMGNGALKPVFRMTDGTPVAILAGKTHLHAVVSEVPAGCVFETEEAARTAQGGW